MFSERLSNIWYSATFRLGIRFMALFALSFLIVGAFIYWQTETYMERELRSLVDAEVAELEDFYARLGPDRVIEEIDERQRDDPFAVGVLLDDDCRPITVNPAWLAHQERPGSLCERAGPDGWLLFELDLAQPSSRFGGGEWDDDVYGRLIPLSDDHQIIVVQNWYEELNRLAPSAE